MNEYAVFLIAKEDVRTHDYILENYCSCKFHPIMAFHLTERIKNNEYEEYKKNNPT